MIENFIRVWPGKVSPEDCQATINAFENILADPELSTKIDNNSGQFSNGAFGRKDLSVFLENPIYNQTELVTKYLYYLQDCVLEYVAEFSQLKDLRLSNECQMKLQKTPPYGGFHIWHYENGGPLYHSRELTWMIYLNDLPDGEGETEFLYQKLRVKPTQGTVVIWPAGMTHPHRGNTVFTHPKYILTGWYVKLKD